MLRTAHERRWRFSVIVMLLAAAGASAETAAAPEKRTEPLQQVGVRDIAAGGTHSCAVSAAGRVFCWGQNHRGQLGNGTTTDSSVPVEVQGLGLGATAVAAGLNFSCAIDGAGDVWCWGSNSSGQLGNGTRTDSLTPVRVSWGLGRNVQALSAGSSHICALNAAGRVFCWGSNSAGQLGDGTRTSRETPVPVPGLRRSGARMISAGSAHTCAIDSERQAYCWGSNLWGQLGDGSRTDRSSPTLLEGVGARVRAIAAGGGHSCAVNGAGRTFCWGANGDGQLGNGATSTVPVLQPERTRRMRRGIQTVVAGGLLNPARGHSCVLNEQGRLRCWGRNSDGQLGDGTFRGSPLPQFARGLGANMRHVSLGTYHSCAINQRGRAFCWGWNRHGQLGDGGTSNLNLRKEVSGALHRR